MAVEGPNYSVESAEAPYEIRDYSPTIVAVVHVDGRRSAAVNSGFRTLAKYLFGDNRTKGKIAMTAPVTQLPSQFIVGTAPMEQHSETTGWEVRFTMPIASTMSSLPAPNDARVRLVEIPRHRVAAIKFSGFWSDTNLQSHEALLLRWMKARNLHASSVAAYAYYDPPWTPWFFRSIEVLMDIAPAPS